MNTLIWKEAVTPPKTHKIVLLHFGDDILETGYFDGSVWKFCWGTPVTSKVTQWARFNYPSEGIE